MSPCFLRRPPHERSCAPQPACRSSAKEPTPPHTQSHTVASPMKRTPRQHGCFGRTGHARGARLRVVKAREHALLGGLRSAGASPAACSCCCLLPLLPVPRPHIFASRRGRCTRTGCSALRAARAGRRQPRPVVLAEDRRGRGRGCSARLHGGHGVAAAAGDGGGGGLGPGSGGSGRREGHGVGRQEARRKHARQMLLQRSWCRLRCMLAPHNPSIPC